MGDVVSLYNGPTLVCTAHDAAFHETMSARIATMYAYNKSLLIDETTMQTSIAALRVNNGAMGVNNVTMRACNATMRVCNSTMEACNAALQVNKNVLTRYITRGYKKWPIFREPNRRFWPWPRK